MGVREPLLVLAVCALVASGCTKSGTTPIATGGGKYGSDVNTNFGDEKQQKPSSEGTAAGSSGSTSKTGAGGTYVRPTLPPDYGGGGGGSVDLGERPNDKARLGHNAYFYLNKFVPKLVVEIDAVHGMAPAPATINLLRQRLASVADKPGGIQILPTQDIGKGRETWTISQVKETEQKFRNNYSNDKVAVMYLIFVDGRPAEGRPIGVAFDASSDVIFEEFIREEAATPLVPASVIEQGVVIHEVGHILSLVNIGYQSPRKHEDAEHEGHSNNTKSVMYWALDNVGVATLLGGQTAPPTDYDADDRADLADVKAGKLRVR
jgi:hypothetical protein